MDAVESQQIASGAKRLVCQDCDEDLDAADQCLDCNLLLCETCVDNHKRSVRTKTPSLVSVAEMKETGKPPPKGRHMCEKHKQKELRLFCKSCLTLICDDCPIKDHRDHDYDLLSEVTSEQKVKLIEEAELVEVTMRQLEEVITSLKEKGNVLQQNATATRMLIRDYFVRLAAAATSRGEELERQLDAACKEKHKVLEGQLSGLELAVASMSSGAEHARRTSEEGNDQEVMEAYTQIAGSLRRLRERSFVLSPETSTTVSFGWEAGWSGDGMLERLAKHGRIQTSCVSGIQTSSASGLSGTAVGAGLQSVISNERASFSVQIRNDNGDVLTERTQANVEVREAIKEEGGEWKTRLVEVNISGGDEDPGEHLVEHEAEGLGQLDLEVLVNGERIQGSPFAVNVGMALQMQSPFDTNGVIHYIGTAGGTRGFQNPHDTGDVVASMSSVCWGQERQLVQGCTSDGQALGTGNSPNSWMAVDLKRFRLAPRAYCLRGSSSIGIQVQSWRLEGSCDGSSWTTLREHVNDLTCKPGCGASWNIDGSDHKGFRHFRILQTHPNNQGQNHLACEGLELYGTLYINQD